MDKSAIEGVSDCGGNVTGEVLRALPRRATWLCITFSHQPLTEAVISPYLPPSLLCRPHSLPPPLPLSVFLSLL